MTNPTSNFGWQMPTSTDLVTDLPADFAVFGQAVDTSMADLKGGTTGQILSKATSTDMDFTWTTPNPGDITGVTAGTGISGGGTSGDVTITNSMATAFTTSGDLIQATGSGTFARLGTGTTGQYLTTNGTTNSWGSVPSANWSLLNAGGTALTGATSITVSGISGKSKLWIFIYEASQASTGGYLTVTINADATAKYGYGGRNDVPQATYSATSFTSTFANVDVASGLEWAGWSNNAASTASGGILIDGCNSSGLKVWNAISGVSAGGGANPRHYATQGVYSGTSTVSSIRVATGAGNFDGGTIYIYGSAV